jgi:hypothetical protein
VHLNPTKAKNLQSFYGEVNQRMVALLDETPERELRSVLNPLSNASRAEEPPASQRRQ